MNRPLAKLPPLMTVADFLDWPGDGTGSRFELVDGVLRAMALGSDTHNTIVTNLAFSIEGYIRRHRPACRVVSAPGVQPHMRADWNFRIPDLGVTCAPNRPGEIMMPEPMLLVEVLSPGNTNDTWENVRNYATLPTVQEILVVHSTQVKAELLLRDDDGAWPENPTPIEGDATVHLTSIGLDLPLAEIFRGTHLGVSPA